MPNLSLYFSEINFFIFLAFFSAFSLSLVLTKLNDWRLLALLIAFLLPAITGKIIMSFLLPINHIVSEKFAALVVMFIAHRSLVLAPIPLLLLAVLIILMVYQKKIADPHAKEYRKIIIFSLLMAWFLFIISMIESWL